MKSLRKYGWAIFLGASLASFANLNFLDLNWWLIVVPTIILQRISREEEIKNGTT